MMLTALALLPIVGGLVLALAPRGDWGRWFAVAVTGATLGLSLAVLARYDVEAGGMQLTEQRTWIEPMGVHYALGVDGLGLTLVLLTTVLTPFVVLAALRDRLPASEGASNGYLAWMLVLEGLAIGVFCATDVFLFYVLFEATLVPIYFLIGSYGTAGRGRAAIGFLVYNLVGGLVMLAAVVGLYVLSADAGEPSYLLTDLQGLEMGVWTERMLFLGFFLAFAIKAPLWPLHTWLPDAAGAATPATSVLMVSVIDKIGTFGMIRFCLGLFPGASEWASPVVMTLAVISILYGALLAIGADDLRRLVALTSVSHFGFIVLGVFALTTTSMAGSVLYMLNHGLSTAVLFLVTGVMIAQRGSADVAAFGGVQRIAPIMSGMLLVGGLSSLSLPGMAPFVSELLVIVGTFSREPVIGAIAALGIVLAAVYVLRLYRRTMTGPLSPDVGGMRDLGTREVAALSPFVVLILALGFYPQPLLDVIEPAVDEVSHVVGVGDPEPRTPAPVAQSEPQEEGH
ncbi:NADH-quinone oxidoreductase subunit M [Aeromicrobium sp. IC_218]|nr:NADH-quinone oxidoreductase subunit M [Aeromicrobium sp. IC_218]TCJ00875.1 NADH-quinone oxidoreductase subunit M [Aeromicrobium sp. IC_218]